MIMKFDSKPWMLTILLIACLQPFVATSSRGQSLSPVEDFLTVPSWIPVILPTSSLLANDLIPDGRSVLVSEISRSTEGNWFSIALVPGEIPTVILTPTRPPPTETVRTSFSYTITSGTETASSTVHLTILPQPVSVYEPFDYAAGEPLASGSQPGSGKNGGWGWTGPWSTTKSIDVFPISNSSLPAPVAGLATAGGSIGKLGSAERPFGPIAIAEGESLWVSALLKTGASSPTDIILVVQFDSGYELRMTDQAQGTPEMHWLLEAYYQSFGPAINPNVPTLLVVEVHRLTQADFRCRLYVNPVLDPAPTSPFVEHLVTGQPRSFKAANRLILTDGGSTEFAGFDEIRLGKSFAAVTGNAGDLNPGNLRLRMLDPEPESTLQTMLFGASEGGSFILERQLLCDGVWKEVSRYDTPTAGAIGFVDAPDRCGALYRVRSTP